MNFKSQIALIIALATIVIVCGNYLTATPSTPGVNEVYPYVSHLTCFDSGQIVLDKDGVFSHSVTNYSVWEWQENGKTRSFDTLKKVTLVGREEIPCLATVTNIPRTETTSQIPFTCSMDGIKILEVNTDNGAVFRDGLIYDPGNAWVGNAWRWTNEKGTFVLTSPNELVCY